MEQNNFEKQVQRKMEELKIHPSESAWDNIEKEIAQHSDRRKIIFVLSIFISLVVFTTFYWIYQSGKTDISKPKTQSAAIVKNKNKKGDLPVEKPVQSNKNHTETEKKIERKYAEIKFKTLGSKKLQNQPQKINGEIILKTEVTGADSPKQNIDQTEVVYDDNIKKAEKSLAALKADSVKEMNLSNVTIESSIKKEDENVKERLAFKKQIKEDTAAVIGPSKISAVKKQKANWDLGIVVTGGTSFAGNDPLSLNKSADYLADPANSGGSQGPNYYMPSKSTNSLAFSAGVFVQRDISAKNKIFIGLKYKYFSTKNKVGNKIDSVQRDYYAAYSSANPSEDFHNNFHFLEVPVTFKLRLNPNKSLPFYWNAGVSISQLISTNALQFKNDPGIYYADNSFFNKTQIGIHTGFSATLFSKSKSPVDIGPYFYYDATNLSNKGLYNKTHFSFIGISAQFLLNKK
jgi:hypothetical protein